MMVIQLQIGQLSASPGGKNAICVTLMSAAEIKTVDSTVATISISGFPSYDDNGRVVLRPIVSDTQASTNLLASLSGKSEGTEPG